MLNSLKWFRLNYEANGIVKKICFILVCLNVVFFLAEYFNPSESGPLSDEALRKSQDRSVEHLVLVRDIEKSSETKQAASVESGSATTSSGSTGDKNAQRVDSDTIRDPGVGLSALKQLSREDASNQELVDPAGLCYRLGPVRSIKSVLPLLESLHDRAIAHSIQSEAFEEESSFFVYYPLNEADQAAGAAIRMLLDKGARDLWRIDRGELRGNISLGVFNTRTRAQVLRLELEAKGIQSKIYAKRLKKPGYSLRFGWPDSIRELESLLLITGLEGQKLAPVEYESCAL